MELKGDSHRSVKTYNLYTPPETSWEHKMRVFTQPLRHKQDITHGQFFKLNLTMYHVHTK